MTVKIKRAYEPAQKDDGCRILVDRVWPRGVRREEAALDGWLREAAPSAGLRRWFGHRPELWPEFRRRYFEELAQHEELLKPLLEKAEKGTLTLVYGAREEKYNNAAALRDYLEERLAQGRSG